MPSTPPIILHLPNKPGTTDREIIIVSNGVEHTLHRNYSTGTLTLEAECPSEDTYQWDPALIFIDTETGGLNPAKDAIFQVGAFHPSSGISIEVLINDTVGDVSPKALEVNNLNLDTIRSCGVSVEEAAAAVGAFMERIRSKHPGRRYVVGHNVSFDTAFIRRLYMLADRRCPKEFLFNRSIDTHAMLYLRNDPTSLDEALSKYKITTDRSRHTALADAKLTASLYKRITSD